MADLPETSEWTPGIYQLETSDPVLGGPEGVDNLAPKQLANRTRWLKDQIDKILNGASNVGKAVRLATARTISLTGAATGSNTFDGSANVAIALTLSDSGVSTGSYTKVTVNAKGLVTAGSAMVAADVPNIDWSKITSGKPTTLDGYGINDAQPSSANLSALAALSSTGLYVSTGAGTAVVRSIAIAGAGLSITNGNGVSGNPTLSLGTSGVAAGSYAKVTVDALGRVTAGSPMVAADVPNLDWSKITSGKPTTLDGYGINDAQPSSANLSALAALSSTGLYVSTGAGMALVRTFAVSGTGLSIANGNGVAGNPTLSLSNSGVVAGSYAKVTVDALGRVTAGSSMVAADVPNLDWSKITTGKPNSLGGYGITDAYTKTQVDYLITTNKSPAASKTVAGVMKQSSVALARAGVDDATGMTPLMVSEALTLYTSAQIPLVAGSQTVLTHSLGFIPSDKTINVRYVCVADNVGYAAGDELDISNWIFSQENAPRNYGFFTHSRTLTQITVGTGTVGTWTFPNKATGTASNITLASWRAVVRIKA